MVYRAAIIGCGKIGSEFSEDPRIKGIFTHAAAYAACPDTELVAVCDPDREKLEKCRLRWQVKGAYTDYREMLRDERPDIVSICTPDETHGRIISDTLRSPGLRAVLAEKPLATDLRKAETIAREARKRHISLAVNYTRRFDPVHHGIRAAVQNGLIGEIQTIIGNYSKGTLHNGTHLFDLARFLIGEIISVRGFQRLEDSDTDPTIDAFLMFQSGASGFFHACDESAFTIFEADIIGTRGRIQFLESGHIIRKYTVADDPFYSGYRALALESTRTDGMHNVLLHAVEDLAGSIAEGREPLCTGEDAVTALRIAFALRKSARQNGRLQHVITHENSAASRLKKDG